MSANRAPQNLTKTDWYYEYPIYLLLVHEVREADGGYIRTDQIKVPWRKIKISLARAYKPRKGKRGGMR